MQNLVMMKVAAMYSSNLFGGEGAAEEPAV